MAVKSKGWRGYCVACWSWQLQQQVQRQRQQLQQQGLARNSADGQHVLGYIFMKTYKNLFSQLCSLGNLQSAYEKAKKRKTNSPRAQKFAEHWQLHLALLRKELLSRAYRPQPLRMFVLRDPKTRVICVSDFCDREVHHALINVLQPIFQPRFIHDSFASQEGKGTSAALARLDHSLRKVSRNGKRVPGLKNA